MLQATGNFILFKQVLRHALGFSLLREVRALPQTAENSTLVQITATKKNHGGICIIWDKIFRTLIKWLFLNVFKVMVNLSICDIFVIELLEKFLEESGFEQSPRRTQRLGI